MSFSLIDVGRFFTADIGFSFLDILAHHALKRKRSRTHTLDMLLPVAEALCLAVLEAVEPLVIHCLYPLCVAAVADALCMAALEAVDPLVIHTLYPLCLLRLQKRCAWLPLKLWSPW